jgi:hypothetical protein
MPTLTKPAFCPSFDEVKEETLAKLVQIPLDNMSAKKQLRSLPYIFQDVVAQWLQAHDNGLL